MTKTEKTDTDDSETRTDFSVRYIKKGDRPKKRVRLQKSAVLIRSTDCLPLFRDAMVEIMRDSKGYKKGENP